MPEAVEEALVMMLNRPMKFLRPWRRNFAVKSTTLVIESVRVSIDVASVVSAMRLMSGVAGASWTLMYVPPAAITLSWRSPNVSFEPMTRVKPVIGKFVNDCCGGCCAIMPAMAADM